MTIIIVIFFLAVSVPLFLKNDRVVRFGSLLAALLAGLSVLSLSLPVLFSAAIPLSNDWWLIDQFSALIVSLVVFVYVMAMMVSVRYIGHEYHEKIISIKRVKIYFSLISLFAFSMVIAVVSNNMAVMWLAMEGTTLSSTFLVGLYKKKASVEAAWKYIILCSTGITIGLLGVLLMNYALHLVGVENGALSLSLLKDNAEMLSPQIVKWAFVFIFVGFGTKVGFVPMHAWLPEAHSKAPSPISAMFSGILLNVALYVIIRYKHVVDVALGGPSWTGGIFIVFGLMSIVLPALALLIQNNFKRMLAYSSIEHMGLISLAVAFPPFGLAASLIHMIGHTITKSLLFFGAGEFLLKFKTTKIDNIKGLMRHAPYSGTLFLLGMLGIIAMPPSVLFVSEFMLFSGMIMSEPVLAITVLVLLSVIAFAMLKLTMSLLFSPGDPDGDMEKEKWNITHSIMTLQLIMVFALSFILTTPSGRELVDSIVKIIN